MFKLRNPFYILDNQNLLHPAPFLVTLIGCGAPLLLCVVSICLYSIFSFLLWLLFSIIFFIIGQILCHQISPLKEQIITNASLKKKRVVLKTKKDITSGDIINFLKNQGYINTNEILIEMIKDNWKLIEQDKVTKITIELESTLEKNEVKL